MILLYEILENCKKIILAKQGLESKKLYNNNIYWFGNVLVGTINQVVYLATHLVIRRSSM